MKWYQRPAMQKRAQDPPRLLSQKQLGKELERSWQRAIQFAAADPVGPAWRRYMRGEVPYGMADLQRSPPGGDPKGPLLRGRRGRLDLDESRVWRILDDYAALGDVLPRAYASGIGDARAIGFQLNRVDLPWNVDRPRFMALRNAPPWVRRAYLTWLGKLLPDRYYHFALRRGTPAGVALGGHYIVLNPKNQWLDPANPRPYLITPLDVLVHEGVHTGDKEHRRPSNELEAVLRELLAKAKLYEIAGRRYPQVWQQAARIPIGSKGWAQTLGDLVQYARKKGIDPDSPDFDPTRRFEDEIAFDRHDPGWAAWRRDWFGLWRDNPFLAPFAKAYWQQALPSQPQRYFYADQRVLPSMYYLPPGQEVAITEGPQFTRRKAISRLLLEALGRLSRGAATGADRQLLEREYNMPLPAMKNLLDILARQGISPDRLRRTYFPESPPRYGTAKPALPRITTGGP